MNTARTDHGAHLLVAVKELPAAKSRLADEFSEQARTSLVLAMLHDTLAAASAAAPVRSWSVVTPDRRVASLVREMAGDVIAEPPSDSSGSAAAHLNDALSAAEAQIRLRWSGDLVVLQADLPALRTSELEDAYEHARRAPRSVVVDHTGMGTAALFAIGSRTALSPSFGPDSARRHVDSGAAPLGPTDHWPGLRLDVDTAADLDAATNLGLGTRTRAVLTSLGRLPVR